LIRRVSADGNRHRVEIPYLSPEMSAIIQGVEQDISDSTLSQNVYFSPTALTHVRRLIEMGGTIITDTQLLASEIQESLLGTSGAKVACFIDDPQVESLAQQRRITRAEVAVDYGLMLPGPELLVVGSAPAAISRILHRRQYAPMSDVCVLAAPGGFASVVQLKERLVDSDISTVVVRGKKGGIPVAAAMVNRMLEHVNAAPFPVKE